ncbi:HAMP domain-containing sensor histidine kinase [Azospirillum oleiclasticum]
MRAVWPMALRLPPSDRLGPWLLHSLASRLVLLTLVFLAVPILIYDQFRRADEVSQSLLLQSAQQQGELIARALEPELARADRASLPRIGQALNRFVDHRTGLKLLVRPRAISGGDGFFYVGAAPAVTTYDLDYERHHLLEQGVLERLGERCAWNAPLALRVPRRSGDVEVLTSITPINTTFGCWALVTSHSTAGYLASSVGRPYWATASVQAAAFIYIGMAALVLAVLTGVWHSLRRFRDLAREIVNGDAGQSSFAAGNTVPELSGVAEDFDRLVETLRSSADTLRRAAEDNAHAFKTPIAVIRQSTEPLRRTLPPEDTRCRRALAMIEASIDKLDGLVSFARRMDETAADTLAPPRRRIDLSGLVERMTGSYAGLLADRSLRLDTRIAPGLVVRAGEEMLETVVENLVENAVSFSPDRGAVSVRLTRKDGFALLVVEDEGPGVDPGNLPRIFERYFSNREPGRGLPADAKASGTAGATHFGIGLWIVRRHVEAVGGRIKAENRETGGFRMTVALPLAT